MVLKKSLSNRFKKYQARVVLWHSYACCGTCVHTHNKYDFKYFSENGACGTCEFLAVILCQRNVLCENLCYRFGTSNRHLTSGKGRVRVCFPDVLIKTMTKGSLQGRDGVNNFTLQLTTHLQGGCKLVKLVNEVKTQGRNLKWKPWRNSVYCLSFPDSWSTSFLKQSRPAWAEMSPCTMVGLSHTYHSSI